jgi:phosphoesterase RecJ-like protein
VSKESLSLTGRAIQEAIQQSSNILVITHTGPDGDAVASLTAVGLALSQWDKTFTLMCDDSVPERFYFLALARRVKRPRNDHAGYDLVIAVDCGDEQRMGQSFASLPQPRPPVINIDHHVTNTRFGQINLVVDTAVSTTEILHDLFTELGLTMDANLAMSLLTGLVTDTLAFRTVGTSAKTLKIASDLMAAGADLSLATSQGLNLKEFATVKLWQVGLDNMKLEDGLLWTTITRQQRKATGYTGSSSNGLSNLLADVEGVAIGAVLMEMGDGTVRVGFRCRPPYNVAELAQNLGGGGHPLAAGCTLTGPLAEVEEQVVMMSKEAIRKQKED